MGHNGQLCQQRRERGQLKHVGVDGWAPRVGQKGGGQNVGCQLIVVQLNKLLLALLGHTELVQRLPESRPGIRQPGCPL